MNASASLSDLSSDVSTALPDTLSPGLSTDSESLKRQNPSQNPLGIQMGLSVIMLLPSILGGIRLIPLAVSLILSGVFYIVLANRLHLNIYKQLVYIGFIGISSFDQLLRIGVSDPWKVNWLDMREMVVQINELSFPSGIFSLIFMFALCVGLIYASLKSAKSLEIGAALIYGGSAIGVSLCGHLAIAFIFWEIMAIAACLILWASRTKGAKAVSFRYFLLHVFGGLIFLIGLCIMQVNHESLVLAPLAFNHLGHYLVLMGVLINVGAPPFWAWVADSYPKASPTGAIFLATFTTKTAVLMLLLLFKGQVILIPIGMMMIVYGIIYALNCRNMRQILAYCIVSQCGYMVVGIGVGNAAALIAVSIQAMAHILYKGLLMMTAGTVLDENPESDIHALGNRCETLPYTAGFALFAGLSLCALPFTLAFASKSMLMDSVHLSFMSNSETYLVLALASGAAPLYVGLRWPWLVFFKDSSLKAWWGALKQPPLLKKERVNIVCYVLFLLPLVAITPNHLYAFSLIPKTYFNYGLTNIIYQFQLIFAAFFIFTLVKNWLIPKHYGLYDFDIFYRRFGVFLVKAGLNWVHILAAAMAHMRLTVYKKSALFRHLFLRCVYILSGNVSSSVMILCACVTLSCALAFLYLR